MSVQRLFVYPIKGLSGQPLDSVVLRPGHGFPHDRGFALARPDGRYRPGIAEPLSKHQFFMLAKDERLAELSTHLDPETERLRVRVRDNPVLDADLSTADGRDRTVAFFSTVLDQAPVLARGGERRFTDVSVVSDPLMNAISVINLASVRDLAGRIGAEVDPRRFRANVYVDGLPPFSELDLVGRELRIGDLVVRAVLNTRRCTATEVNPDTASRDLNVPKLLIREYGHSEMGVYVEVLQGGTLRTGDPIELLPLRSGSSAI
jgi:uncharacterized protein